MSLVGAFPFINNDLHTVTIFMPYWDVLLKTVKWKEFNDVYFTNQPNTDDGFQGCVAKWAWLNKCNPDWQLVTPAVVFPNPGLTGQGFISMQDARGCVVTITGGMNLVDKWWGSSNIGKYGVIAYSQSGVPVMPYRFVNNNICAFENTDIGNDGLFFNFPAGITGEIDITSASLNGTKNYTIPPVYYMGLETIVWAGSGQDEPTTAHELNYIP